MLFTVSMSKWNVKVKAALPQANKDCPEECEDALEVEGPKMFENLG